MKISEKIEYIVDRMLRGYIFTYSDIGADVKNKKKLR